MHGPARLKGGGMFKLDATLLRQELAEALALVEAHWRGLAQKPVKPQLKEGDVARLFARELADHGASMTTLMQEVQGKILPALTLWQHPRFWAYYPATTSNPAVVGEMLVAALGAVGLQWSASPAVTELECVVMDWLMRLLHADDSSPFLHTSRRGGGIIQNTASEAIIVVMVAARIAHQRLKMRQELGRELSDDELQEAYYRDASRLVVYMSDQTHFSGEKAARVAGLRVHKIKASLLANGNYGLTANQVKQAMDEDRNRGLTPLFCLLNFGSTNTAGCDDLAGFKGFAERESVWLHVDAAYAGPALMLKQFAQDAKDLQQVASSFNFNGSKWLLSGFDSAFLFVKDRAPLKAAYAASGSYLAVTESENVYNPEFKDWSLPLGRRFRALRIWLVLRYFGAAGLRAFLQQGIDQAGWLAAEIDASKHFAQIVRGRFGLLCFALRDQDLKANQEFIARLGQLSQDGREFLLYPSVLDGRPFLRVALGGNHTTMEDLKAFWAACLKAVE